MAWQHWSTSDIDRGLSEYWHEVIRRGVVPAALEDAGSAFTAKLHSREVASFRFVSFVAGRHRITRTPKQARCSDDGHYMLSLQSAGRLRVQQGGESALVHPGELLILHSGRAFDLTFDEAVNRQIVLIPRNMIDRYLPRHSTIGFGRPVHLNPRNVAGKVSIDIIRHLTEPGTAWAEDDCKVSVECLAKLIAEAVRRSDATDRAHPYSRPKVSTADAAELISRRSSDFELTPLLIAQELGISLRTLHRLLSAGETTFSRCLLNARLDNSVKLLKQDRERRTILSIAMETGFCDAAHFSRSFRQRFGVSPNKFAW